MGIYLFLADGEGFPRTMLTHRLRGNRDDLTALHWSNLLVVEQGFSSAPPIHKIKRGGWGGIRTPGGVAPTTVFKTVAIDRSATHPKLFIPPVFQTYGFVRCPHLAVLLTTRSHSTALMLVSLTRMQDRRNRPLCHPS